MMLKFSLMERPECQAKITRHQLINDHLNVNPRTQIIKIECANCPVANTTLTESTQHPLSDAMKLNRAAKGILIEACELRVDGSDVIAPEGLKPNGDPDGLLDQTRPCENGIWQGPRPAGPRY